MTSPAAAVHRPVHRMCTTSAPPWRGGRWGAPGGTARRQVEQRAVGRSFGGRGYKRRDPSFKRLSTSAGGPRSGGLARLRPRPGPSGGRVERYTASRCAKMAGWPRWGRF